MNRNWTKIISFAVLPSLLALWVTTTIADESKGIPSPDSILKAMAESGKPNAELAKLEPLVGEWTVTMRLWTDPSQPPAELKGTVERKWIMGNRFVQENLKGEYAGASFEGMGVWGYDATQKKFSITRICGLCAQMSHSAASVDPSAKKFESMTEECCPITGQKIKGRDEVVIESNDKIVVNVYKSIDNKEVKAMEIVSVRKKS